MKYLIDTHTFIWFNVGSSLLGSNARKLIEDSNNQIYISMASLWEIAIKTSLQKLSIAGPYESVWDDLQKLRIDVLPIDFKHTCFLNRLSYHHKDPFDRMIVSQAVCEGIVLLSADDQLDSYLTGSGSKRIW